MEFESPAVAHICFGGEGGQLTAVRTLVREFDLVGVTSAVLALGPPQLLKRDLREWSNPKSLVPVPITRRGDLGSMMTVASTIRRLNPRVILRHSHRHAVAGVIGQVLAGRRPALVVVEHQSTHLRSRKDNFLSGLATAVSRGVVFLTRQYRQQYPVRWFQVLLRRPGFVVPNGIRICSHESLGREGSTTRRQTTKTIGIASRLVPTKEHDVLIHALRILRTQPGYEGVRLVVAGEGPTLDELMALTADLDLTDSVHFLGHISADEVPEFLQTLDVYAHATLGEGFSIALLEAAAAGVPIVVSDVSGVNEFFVDGETAVLVPASDPKAMARALTQALDPQFGFRLARAAREWVISNYSAEQVAAGYLGVLQVVDPDGDWSSLTR